MSWHVNQHLAHALPADLEKQHITIIGTISSVVEVNANQHARFNFVISSVSDQRCKWLLPATVQLAWDNPPQHLLPGDTWALNVKLKLPRNYSNVGSFDTEKLHFQQRIVATGYVLAAKKNYFIQHQMLAAPINLLRQLLLQKIVYNLRGQPFTGVLIALTLGLKHNITYNQQQVFQNSGVAHLMSISGLHMGIICSMIFMLLRVLWRYVPVSWLHLPAPWLAAWGALIVSIAYALLAGFSIATQRSLIMIIVFLSGLVLKRKTCTVHAYSLALLVVLLCDPFSVLSLGFWLSFSAVGLLIYALRGRKSKWWQQQWVITVGLLPLTLLFFSQCSIIAPITNLIAIPWVSFTVLPLALLGAVLTPISTTISTVLLTTASKSFALLWPVLDKLSQLPVYNWQTPQDNLVLITITALISVLWLFIPRGLPGRYWGIVGLLPLFLGSPEKIPHGHAQFILLDVGQGLAAVIKTKNNTLVYDTGARLTDQFDLGSRVVAPFLQTLGVKKIDMLMVSHADNDHIGGAIGLMGKFKADLILTTAINELQRFNPRACVAGQQWQWDGVIFTVLHPETNALYAKRNNNSCVLMVQAGSHKVLLTGDIETLSERELILRYGSALQANIMLVPHHGSKTSSSPEFLERVKPEFALIPVGYKNQYGHPKQHILERYQELNIAVLSTELDGAISFRLGSAVLQPRCYRREQHWFWIN